MARIEFAPEVLDDFDRILDHLDRFEVADGPNRLGEIVAALQILTHSPHIGRPTRGGMRELVIGRAGHGDIVLYRFVDSVDAVFILAIRGQRDQGFKRGE